MHVSSVPSPRTARLGVHAQSQTTSTSLSSIAFARHIARRLIHSRSAIHLISAEALTAIFCACHAVSLGITIGYALRVGDGMLADVGKCDAGENAVAAAKFVREATLVGPTGCDV